MAVSKRDYDNTYLKTIKEQNKKQYQKSNAEYKKKQEEKWYQQIVKSSDAFDDGWQFGDITKTALGTAGDLASTGLKAGWNVVKETGMNVAGANYWLLDKSGILPGAYDAFMDIDVNDQDVAVVSDIDKGVNKINKATQDNSIIGDFTRDTVQSSVESAANAYISSMSGLPVWQVNSFATGYRNEYVNALKSGATKEEAAVSAITNGTSQVLSEYIFSGFIKMPGTGGTIDKALGKATEKIGNKFLRTVTQYGINIGGEAFEEVLSGFGSALGQKLTYLKDVEFKDIYSFEDAIENAAAGAFSAMFGSANPQTIQNIRDGRNLVTGLTSTQHKYIDEIAQQRMVEAQKRNEKLSLIQKGKIEQRTQTDFQKGRLADANKLQQVNLPGLSTKDMDLQQSAYKYGFNPNSEAIVTAKTMLDNRGIKSRFDADAFKNINGNAYWTNKNGVREVVFNPNASEQAILEEIAMHELTHDLMSSENSKTTLNKQNIIDYVSTLDGYKESRAKLEKLYANQTKGMSKQKANALINEEIIADTLGKNIGSQEYIRRLIDDEPSIAKNIYDWVVNKVANKSGVKNEKAYWNNVKNNFEKAYNMEYQGKGSNTKYSIGGKKGIDNVDLNINKEFTQYVEKAKNSYDKALGMAQNGYTNEQIRNETKWYQDRNGDWKFEFTDKDFNLKIEPKNIEVDKVYKLGDLVEHKFLNALYPEIMNYDVKFTKKRSQGSFYKDTKSIEINQNKLTQKNAKNSIEGTLIHEIQHAIQQIEGFEGGRTSKLSKQYYYESLGEAEATDTRTRMELEKKGRLNRENTPPLSFYKDAKHPNYENYMENRGIIDKIKDSLYSFITRGGTDEVFQEVDKENQKQNRTLVDGRGRIELDNSSFFDEETRYSLTDNQGRELTKEQQEFFKDSKARDPEGELKVLYHGTPNEFNKFSYEFLGTNGTLLGKGFYLTDDINVAQAYANKSNNGKVMELYTNITKPLKWGEKSITKSEYQSFVEKVNEETNGTLFADYSGEYSEKGSELYNSTLNDILMDYEYGGDDIDLVSGILNATGMSWDKGYKILTDTTGFDGIIVTTDVYDSGEGNVYIPFQSNQIKNVDNTNPTEDADIRKSQQTEGWQSFLDKNFEAKGTRTRLSDIKLPGLTNVVQEEVQKPSVPKVDKPVENKNLPLRKEESVLKLDANQIADALNGNTKDKIQVPGGKKLRRWSETSTKSDVLKDFIGINELDINRITYVPISNRKTLENADNKLSNMSYEEGIEYIKGQLTTGNASLTDIAIAEKLIVEARNRQDTTMVADLLMDVSILGTELGQKVQALSIIQKMTPEGQLKMYQKILTRAKAKGTKGFENVEITPDMVKTILDAYDANGNYNQDDLNNRVEVFKQQIAEQMTSTWGEKADEWRYLSMLGNPKTHIRNVVSNVAMKGTLSVKNAVARTLEMALPQAKRTKTWKAASSYVQGFAEQTAEEWKGIISGDAKYTETKQLNKMKKTFKSETLNKLSNLNSKLLEMEDWLFSKSAFKNSLQEYLTAQGIKTEQDIADNPETVEKAKMHALEQAQIATFRQYSWLANKINEIENKNKATKVLVGAVMPFKKTPINVAKAGINYSPLGLIKTMSYDLVQVKNGNMEASQFIDNLAQGLTGTSLTLLGYALAKAGFITGGGDDDKESKYDYALGNQTYALKIGNNTYSISWLSPVAMPLLVGANAFSELEEKEEWDVNVLMNTLASTLDPISEMSFISSLTDVLQSYQQGSMQMISNMGQSAFSSYVTQYFPTLFSQIASVFDDKKRSTRASGDSKFKYGEELFNQIRYKIPGLRNTLPVATDIWGNEQKQAENIVQRAFETFIAPYNRKSVSNTTLDKELKRLYNETGETAVIPGTPSSYIKYKDERYDMNNKEYVSYKKTYGTKANEYLNSLIETDAYKNATDEEKAKMVQEIYGYAGAYAKKDFFSKRKVDYTSDEIKAINKFEELKMNSNDIGEFVAINKLSSTIENDKDLDASEKRAKIGEYMLNANLKDNQLAYLYSKYYSSEEELNNILTLRIPMKEFIKFDLADIEGKYNTKTGKTINGSKKNATIEFVNTLNLTKAQRAILVKSVYSTYKTNDNDIIRYVNTLPGTVNEKKVLLKSIGFDNYDKDVVNYILSQNISAEEKLTKLDELGFTIRDGRVYY